MSKLVYTVHSAVKEPVPVEATTADGRAVIAYVDGLTVELTNGNHGPTFRFTTDSAAELDEQVALFAVGASITLTFSGVPAPAPVVSDAPAQVESVDPAPVASDAPAETPTTATQEG